jgi:ribosomal-protein-alanine N-acetyltransferase
MAELGGVRSDAETGRYLERNSSHWDTYGFGVWMLRPKGGQHWIGRTVLRWLSTGTIDDVEIGYAFLPTYWGQGLATEAAEFCLGVARAELELRTVIGVTTPENLASQRVLEKVGLRYESDTVVERTRCFLYRVRW